MSGRRVELQGASNFRDLGGLETGEGRRVRRGHVFRADALHRLLPEDLAVLAPLGIGHVIDLRADSEVRRDGAGGIPGARRTHAPLVETTLSPFDPDIDWERIDLGRRYCEMLTVGGPAIAAVLEAAAGETPIVFHCTAGKDRTGVVAAVLLGALGVSVEAIAADYAWSEVHLRAHFAAMRADLQRKGFAPQVIEYVTASPPMRMRRTLEELARQWTSVNGYLEWIGVDEDLRARLRARLLL